MHNRHLASYLLDSAFPSIAGYAFRERQTLAKQTGRGSRLGRIGSRQAGYQILDLPVCAAAGTKVRRTAASVRWGLGPLHTVGLAEAREMARQSRLLVQLGRRAPFERAVAIDPGRAPGPRVAVPRVSPSTFCTASAPTLSSLSWLIPTPHTIAVDAPRSPSPTTTQHSLPSGPLRPYLGRTFTGWIAPTWPGARKI
jgi:hypothetical protein